MKRNYASVRIERNTYNVLKKLKETQGIPITEGIRVAVERTYETKEKMEG